METFGRIWASGCTSMLVYGAFEWVRGPEKWSKLPNIRLLDTLWAFPLQKTSFWIHFLVVQIYGGFWENMGPWVYFFAFIWGVWVGQRGSKLLKMTKYTTFGHFKGIFTSKNLVLNTFSGRTNLWRLLGEYELLGVLLWSVSYTHLTLPTILRV